MSSQDAKAIITPEQDDDLHLLMAIAVLVGQRGTDAKTDMIYDAWSRYYPQDALGAVGRGLQMIGQGDTEGGIALIEKAAEHSATRAQQARDVLQSLRAALESQETQ